MHVRLGGENIGELGFKREGSGFRSPYVPTPYQRLKKNLNDGAPVKTPVIVAAISESFEEALLGAPERQRRVKGGRFKDVPAGSDGKKGAVFRKERPQGGIVLSAECKKQATKPRRRGED